MDVWLQFSNLSTPVSKQSRPFMPMVERWILAVILVAMTACATTQQAKTVERSGFLDDYSILQKGAGGSEALLRYVNPMPIGNTIPR